MSLCISVTLDKMHIFESQALFFLINTLWQFEYQNIRYNFKSVKNREMERETDKVCVCTLPGIWTWVQPKKGVIALNPALGEGVKNWQAHFVWW